MIDALFAVTNFSEVFYGILVPLLLAQLLALVLIPGLQQSGARPRLVIQACYEYLMLGTGVLLMTIGALPTISSVLANAPYAGNVYFAHLLIFAVGGGTFLWHEQRVRTIDAASRAVPAALFFYVVKIIGHLTLLMAFLLLGVSLILGDFSDGFWLMPLVLGLYGGLLLWCTRMKNPVHVPFQSVPMPISPLRAPLRQVPEAAKKTMTTTASVPKKAKLKTKKTKAKTGSKTATVKTTKTVRRKKA